jgi:mRNA interferase HigB
MRVIAKRTLREFWERHPSNAPAKTPLQDWYAQVSAADWAAAADLKAQFRDASILRSGRVVFNIGGNKYRLVVRINYSYRVVYVRLVGTHEEYDRIDANTV